MGEELKAVWLVNRLLNEVKKGKLIKPDGASDAQSSPALIVEIEHEPGVVTSIPSREPESWIFATEEEAQMRLKEKIEADIQGHKEEINQLQKELSAVAFRVWILTRNRR